MRKSQQVALNSRPYAFKALQLLSVLGQHSSVRTDLMKGRHIKNTLLVIVTSDRGLAGSFNSQVLRLADSFLKSYEVTTSQVVTIAVGKKAVAYVNKKELKLVGEFYGFGDFIKSEETGPLADALIRGYLNKDWDRVMTISTHFRTTLKQEVLMRQVLPVDLEKIKQTLNEIIPEHGRFSELRTDVKHSVSNKAVEYIFEPSPKKLIEGLVDHLVRMQVYHLVLEANASEHSARMVAMKTASDNANELSEKLNLEYNKARQAGITKELIEITSAVNTLQ